MRAVSRKGGKGDKRTLTYKCTTTITNYDLEAAARILILVMVGILNSITYLADSTKLIHLFEQLKLDLVILVCICLSKGVFGKINYFSSG